MEQIQAISSMDDNAFVYDSLGSTFAIGHDAKVVRIYEYLPAKSPAPTLKATLKHTVSVTRALLTSDLNYCLTSDKFSIYLWDIKNARMLNHMKAPELWNNSFEDMIEHLVRSGPDAFTIVSMLGRKSDISITAGVPGSPTISKLDYKSLTFVVSGNGQPQIALIGYGGLAPRLEGWQGSNKNFVLEAPPDMANAGQFDSGNIVVVSESGQCRIETKAGELLHDIQIPVLKSSYISLEVRGGNAIVSDGASDWIVSEEGSLGKVAQQHNFGRTCNPLVKDIILQVSDRTISLLRVKSVERP
ncbi:MAG: hypothetical protein JNJ45_01905 [Chthonomonas sp.]|nr:hypothetical protein [Chthonomonas sp.]